MPSLLPRLTAVSCLAVTLAPGSASADAPPALAPPAPAAPASSAPWFAHRRLGIEGTAGFGTHAYLGAAIRGELEPSWWPRRSGHLRIGYARGLHTDEYAEEFQTLFGGAGVRAYNEDNLYSGVEAGLLVMRRWEGHGYGAREDSPWELAPYFVLGFGYRGSVFDVGFNFSLPAAAMAVTLGFDL